MKYIVLYILTIGFLIAQMYKYILRNINIMYPSKSLSMQEIYT